MQKNTKSTTKASRVPWGILVEAATKHKQIHKKEKKKMSSISELFVKTYPASFALVSKRFLRVLCCSLDIIHGVFDMVLDTIDHFTLKTPRK